ncbi:DUF1616 domain-containing protein [Thermoproteota archaeon]
MENQEINNLILKKINEEEPETLDELINSITLEAELSKKELLGIIREMENDGMIKLKEPLEKNPETINDYVFSKNSLWFWAIVLIVIVTLNAIFLISAENSGLIYIRYILGSVFILFLPGFTLVKALFPLKKTTSLETVVLSIGATLSLLPVVALTLNNTPWGIRLVPVTLFLLLFTISFALIGLVREFNQR